MIYEYEEPQCNEIDRRDRRTRRKTCPSITSSTTNPTWIDPDIGRMLTDDKLGGLYHEFYDIASITMLDKSVLEEPLSVSQTLAAVFAQEAFADQPSS
jgi:hypothetical protein